MTHGTPEAVIAAAAARALSPATLEDLEADLASGGAAYRFLAGRANALLDRSRTANPVVHDGCWAFDIDGFVFVTSIPHGMGRNYRDAREVLEVMLRRSTEAALPVRLGIRATLSAVPEAPKKTAAPSGRKNVRSADDVLSSAHYTSLPAWVLSNSLDLSVSERIVLSDVLDVVSGGTVLSYEYDSARLRARCGIKASTASGAFGALVRRGILARVEGCRGRYAVRWDALRSMAMLAPEGAEALGAAMTDADVRRRLCSKRRSLALPVWAVEFCGATEAALLLAKGWAVAHGGSDGVVWASGATLSRWLPGCDRSLRRARAALAQSGAVSLNPQYSATRVYAGARRPNRTAEFRVDAAMLARTLIAHGVSFGPLAQIAESLFCESAAQTSKTQTAPTAASGLAHGEEASAPLMSGATNPCRFSRLLHPRNRLAGSGVLG